MASPRPLPTAVALLLLMVLAVPALRAAGEPAIPPATGYVTDTAGILGEWRAKTEKLCREIEGQTGAEVSVLTVTTTAPLETQQYAQQVFDRWKIGKKGKDNGVLILVASADRKLWIATGYGVEGVLPDGKVGEIRDRVLRPLFRQGRYGEGIYMGVAAIGSVLSGGKIAAPKDTARPHRAYERKFLNFLFLALLPLLFIWSILRWASIGGSRRGGGGYYGGYG
ncbi:MAG: TPM domain-containing protein, partial [Deltaproteobacteria bacterium]|nr:TPM domain-containing protein [Deltaproteobacteria bacterium]